MMTLKQNFLRGSYTPLITPFRDGRVDFNAFGELVDRQAREGSHGVVVAGTTGEPSSLTIQERKDLLRAGLEAAAAFEKPDRDACALSGFGVELDISAMQLH